MILGTAPLPGREHGLENGSAITDTLWEYVCLPWAEGRAVTSEDILPGAHEKENLVSTLNIRFPTPRPPLPN